MLAETLLPQDAAWLHAVAEARGGSPHEALVAMLASETARLNRKNAWEWTPAPLHVIASVLPADALLICPDGIARTAEKLAAKVDRFKDHEQRVWRAVFMDTGDNRPRGWAIMRGRDVVFQPARGSANTRRDRLATT